MPEPKPKMVKYGKGPKVPYWLVEQMAARIFQIVSPSVALASSLELAAYECIAAGIGYKKNG